MSQGKLGEALGVTFQQIQKYEKGSNRIGASRLQQIARTLAVPPSYFFDGAPTYEVSDVAEAESVSATYTPDFLTTSEGLELNRAFAKIGDTRVRKRVIELVTALAEFKVNA